MAYGVESINVGEDLDNLFCDEAINDPASYFGRLRSIDPVYWNERWGGWIVTGYATVVQAHRSETEEVSVAYFSGLVEGSEKEQLSTDGLLARTIANMFALKDPPEHTKLRQTVMTKLTPKEVEMRRPDVARIIRDLIEHLRQLCEFDFAAQFASKLPSQVIALILGLPQSAHNEVEQCAAELSDVLGIGLDDGSMLRRAECAISDIIPLFDQLARARRNQPRDDLMTQLILAQQAGQDISDDEIIANSIGMVFAGHETTSDLLNNGLIALNRHPEQCQRLRKNPEMIGIAVEEILRFDSPVKGQPRWARKPFDLGGHQIESGDRLLISQYAANHDPAAFAEPENFDIGRSPNKHVAFGRGIHACAGAALARMEAQEVFKYLVSEFDNIELLESQLQYRKQILLRGVSELRVALHEN